MANVASSCSSFAMCSAFADSFERGDVGEHLEDGVDGALAAGSGV